jgi:hypothetical protein
MAISVVCPGCNARFKVSEKYAGKKGPCPKCKIEITVPQPEPEVQIHAPEDFAGGGKSAQGVLITKPLKRLDAKLKPVMAAAITAGSLGMILVAWLGGKLFLEILPLRIAGLVLVSPFLTVGAYGFLRDDELEAYEGRALWLRGCICAAAYAALWGIYYVLVTTRIEMTGEMWQWLMVAPPFLFLGALAAFASLDLDWGSAAFHYAFYLLVTLLLRAAIGMQPLWYVSSSLSGG